MEKIMNEGDDWMNWNETLRNNVTRAQELKTYMRLTSQEEEHMTRILEQFPMTVTRYCLLLTGTIRNRILCSGCLYPPFVKPTCRGTLIPAGRRITQCCPACSTSTGRRRSSCPPTGAPCIAGIASASGWWESPAAKQPEMWTRWLPTSSPTLK